MTFEITKHKNILIKILKNIYTDPTIGPVLGFKGGTAAYLFYGLNRFSVDLDFDLLDESKEDYVFEKIEKIIKEFGVIKEKYKKQHTLFFILSYTEETPNVPNIKVEISRRNFGSGYELKNYLGISMLVMIKEDMFAHKLVAMHERL
ncbi:nucleotidyl transferase AbiEii/AbiGii toxin family protein, partial [Patescibacteria group bacterium]|nr:nucleotidyl transferase AbiEii/AbiGii toxin family protein [Patescibacteria group bacterium]